MSYLAERPNDRGAARLIDGNFFAMTRNLSRRFRILVVDDEALIRWSLKERLTQDGHDVMEAADAKAALQHLDGDAVDLVLVDLKMPGDNGIQLVEQMRARRILCPAILMTAYGTPKDAVDAARVGIGLILHKPFDLDDVVRAVEQALKPVD
jgi:DNA-binding NtrC family response regulator